ncbi:hypothetical protein GCM10023238_28660 [Streptomyces heliomycini]
MNDERYDPLVYAEPMESPVPHWDPAEELAYLLQEARSEEPPGAAMPQPREETPVTAPPAGSPLGNLQEITAELPPLRAAPRGHRKPPRRRPDALRLASYATAALTAVTVSMVSVLSGVVTYDPLLLVTTAHSSGSSSAWWPVLVYAPGWRARCPSSARHCTNGAPCTRGSSSSSSRPSPSRSAWPRPPGRSPTRPPRPFRARPPWPASSNSSARSP